MARQAPVHSSPDTSSPAIQVVGLTKVDGARIWVGDYGPWKKLLGGGETFRKAPSFDARAAAVKAPALLERLLASYTKKYPAEIGKWRDRFTEGYADGSRVLIRYTPRT